MKLLELLSRACADAPSGLWHIQYNRAIHMVLRKWPRDRRYTEDQLTELRAELKA